MSLYEQSFSNQKWKKASTDEKKNNLPFLNYTFFKDKVYKVNEAKKLWRNTNMLRTRTILNFQ